MAEAVWNGFLRVSLVSCPVYLVPATSSESRVQLDPLNARTGNPLTQQFVDSKTGDVVPSDAVVSGCKVGQSRYIVVSADELKQLASSPANVIDIEQFVPRDQLGRLYLDAACYIVPEGQLASDTVQALRVAMEHSGRIGIGRVVIGDRERVVLIEAHGSGLMLSPLQPLQPVEPPAAPEHPVTEVSAEMVEIAETIIGRRAVNFDPDMLRDRSESALQRLVEAKARAATPPSSPPAAAPPPPPPPEPASSAPLAAPAPPPQPAPSAPLAAPAPPPESASAAPVTAPAAPLGEVTEPSPAAPDGDPLAQPADEPVPPETELDPPEPTPPVEPASSPHLSIDGLASLATPPARAGATRELGTEVLLHIMGLGDRRYVEAGWAGHPGSRRQIEALSIRPRDELPPSTVEFRVFAQEGRATAWVSNGNYAGTRGRGLPLTGFAIRPAADLRDRLEIVYEGSFFEGGVVGPKRDGELCVSPVADDPLEAIRVSIIERVGG